MVTLIQQLHPYPLLFGCSTLVPAFFAYLYSRLGDGRRTTTIQTQDAAPEIAELHHPMPIILSADQIKPWMACEDGDYGWPDGFNHHAINSFGINDDGAELIDPYDLVFWQI